jgi:hypothetical protein
MMPLTILAAMARRAGHGLLVGALALLLLAIGLTRATTRGPMHW